MSLISRLFLVVFLGFASNLPAAEAVFSGPQPGEKTTPFKVLAIAGQNPGQERDPIGENAGRPLALVFIHGLERSLVPLLRTVDQYGSLRTNRLKTELVFLAPDRLAGEQRVKAAARSLQLQATVGLSLDGAEGPGNYGLNKECLMTIVAASENKVAANFALVQPGIADAPKVIEALARLCGDTNPPTIEELSKGRPASARDPDGTMRAGTQRPAANKGANQEKFPGEVPTDPRLNALMRQLIRPTNDVATVDKLLADLSAHIKDNPDLIRQTSNGWTRILHFGDHYGTEYARKKAQEFLQSTKSAPAPPK